MYDRVASFEANERLRASQREEEEGDSDDDADTLEARRLEAGAYSQQRLAVVMVVTAAHSSAVARRVREKLHQVWNVYVCVQGKGGNGKISPRTVLHRQDRTPDVVMIIFCSQLLCHVATYLGSLPILLMFPS